MPAACSDVAGVQRVLQAFRSVKITNYELPAGVYTNLAHLSILNISQQKFLKKYCRHCPISFYSVVISF